MVVGVFFFFRQKTAYDMRISDWSSDVCSADLLCHGRQLTSRGAVRDLLFERPASQGLPRTQRRHLGGENTVCFVAWDGWQRLRIDHRLDIILGEIGRASCRARVCQYV